MADPVFDPVIHAPHRLRICAIAYSSSHVEFRELQNRLGISKSALSKQLVQLLNQQYLRQEHVTRDGRSRLQLILTSQGREAYEGHLLALEEIVATQGI